MIRKPKDLVRILITIIVGFISFYAQSRNPETGNILFVSLLGFIIVYYLISFIVATIKERINQIDSNTESIRRIKEDLNNLKDKIDTRKEIENIKVRIAKLEK